MIRTPCQFTLTCGIALFAGLSGCSDPRAAAPTRTRLERIDLHLTQLGDREADGPRRLANMGKLIEAQSRWHDEHFARDVRRVGDWTRRDVDRWHERQPVYRARITDALDGDLKHANDTIPWMFYEAILAVMPDAAATGDAPWTVLRLMQWTQAHLAGRGVPEPRLATEILLGHALSCKRIELYTRFESVPAAEPLGVFRDLVRRAAQHAPIAYLVGRKEFYSLDFEVGPAVLIPRPETEALVTRAVKLCAEGGLAEPRFLDVGTGSGCVAVAILKQIPAARGVATDVSEEALVTARRNAERHGVTERLSIVRADRLVLPAGTVPEGGFDLVVSNPPYIPEGQRASLAPQVRDYEPGLALFDGGDGLSFYRSFAEAGASLLRPGGAFLVEIGYSQRPAVVEIFTSAGRFEHVGTWRDPGDPHDRVLEFRLR